MDGAPAVVARRQAERVASLLAELELLWRGRVARIDDLIASENAQEE